MRVVAARSVSSGGLIKKVVDYTRPKVVDAEDGLDTSGNLKQFAPGLGVIAGGVQGYLTGKLVASLSGNTLAAVPVAMAGTVGGYAGLKVAQASGSAAAGVGAAAVAGAASAAVATCGLASLTGATTALPLLAVSALVGGASAASGTMAGLPGGFGVMSGSIQGYFAGNGAAGSISGSVGSFVGASVGRRSHSTLAAVGAGATAGAAVGAATTAGLATVLSGSIPWPVVGGAALLGGFAGAVGTMAGSLKASTRDSVYGGLALGALATAYTGNPAMAIAGAAGAGLAGVARTRTGQVALGVLTGAAAGAIAGAPGGLPAIATGALAGAIVAPMGSLVGSTFMQVRRNLTVDGVNLINKRLVNPYIDKHPLGETGKLVAGAAAGAIVGGAIGMVAGPGGAALLGSVGAVGGALKADQYVKAVRADQTVQKYGGKPGLYDNVIEAQEAALLEHQAA